MALTAEQLYNACQIEPSSLGETIIDPEDTADAQLAAAIAYIESDVLPGAIAEVSTALKAVSGKGSISDFVECRFPDLESADQTAMTDEGEPLFDAVVKSYGRSEVNKVVNTDRREYDEDSDQDRKQGDAKLKKLIDWVTMVIKNTDGGILDCDGDTGGAAEDPTNKFKGRMQSYRAVVKAVW